MRETRLAELDDKICTLYTADGGWVEKQRGQTPLPRQLATVEVEIFHLFKRRIVCFIVSDFRNELEVSGWTC